MSDKHIVMISGRMLLADSLAAAMERDERTTATTCTPGNWSEPQSGISNADLVLIDAPCDPDACLTLILAVRRRRPDCRIALVADGIDTETLTLARAHGASGFVTTRLSFDAFSQACRLMAKGIEIFPKATQPAPPQPRGANEPSAPAVSAVRDELPDSLSERESEILAVLPEGLSNKEIARRFDISEATVKTHLKGILRKIGVSNRTKAAIWAHERGIGAVA